jgi:hypothetical protein
VRQEGIAQNPRLTVMPVSGSGPDAVCSCLCAQHCPPALSSDIPSLDQEIERLRRQLIPLKRRRNSLLAISSLPFDIRRRISLSRVPHGRIPRLRARRGLNQRARKGMRAKSTHRSADQPHTRRRIPTGREVIQTQRGADLVRCGEAGASTTQTLGSQTAT